MCTVTFIPKDNHRFVLTSNRDEAPLRTTILPQIYSLKGSKILFPKDAVAGGTWIGASDKMRVVCLLNGGFTAHQRQDSYRMSRGIIVTDLLATEDALAVATAYNYTGIEPFTLLLVNFDTTLQLHEIVWDGEKAHFSEKPLAPQIWSSSLLYTEAVKKKREQWFHDFLLKHPEPTKTELLHFHKTAGEGNSETNLVMDRDFVATKSITQIYRKETSVKMRYEDVVTSEKKEKQLRWEGVK